MISIKNLGGDNMKRNKAGNKEESDDEEWIVDDVYSDEGAESLLEDDEISEFEAGFMQGYNS